jgi:hypothetical protein
MWTWESPRLEDSGGGREMGLRGWEDWLDVVEGMG